MQLALFILVGLALAGAAFFIIRKKREEKKSATENVWPIPFAEFQNAVLMLESEMIDDGFGPDDYVENVFDCSEYAPEWCRRLRKKLAPLVPKGMTIFIYPFSFAREDKPARHQVAAVRTDEGEYFVDTYRLANGKLLRTLTDNEKLNGNYIYK